MWHIVGSFGGVGYAPVAAGTWGSAAALVTGYLLHWAGGFPLLAVATVLALVAGLWAAARDSASSQTVDPSWIVIDEVVGMWIALFPLSLGLWLHDAPASLFPWPGWVSAFLIFRALDIWKPGPVGWADRRHGAAGVMLDDVIAGVLTALAVTAMAGIAHGWLQ
jgi:phosphatidylglycerophosphatase A